jgi:DNA processing protein
VRGGLLDASRAVAVVGSRAALPEALTFARDLGSALARAGAVVVSGGAVGVDAHAHEGALDANGRTWAIAGTGQDHCYPPEHAALFDRIGKGPGAMVWPFEAHYGHRSGFLARNRVLVALADAVVVVQAGIPSGALHAAAWARKLDKPLWVVPAAPWMKEFAGSRLLLEKGARSLTSLDGLFGSIGLASAQGQQQPRAKPASVSLSIEESTVLAAISSTPLHLDQISDRAHLSAQVTGVALLTLALENVVVEGPPGFYTRRDVG